MGVKPDIELHIGELVIDGARPADRYRIAESVERELARLLSELGFPMGIERNVHIDRFDGGRITQSSSARAETLGARIARSLYDSLKVQVADRNRSRT